jgi:hypothetical protein
MSDQKTIDTSPVLGSAELTILGEVQLFYDLFTHFAESSLQTILDGIFAPYRMLYISCNVRATSLSLTLPPK